MLPEDSLTAIAHVKRCIECGKAKPLDGFQSNKSNSIDGKTARCKACLNTASRRKRVRSPWTPERAAETFWSKVDRSGGPNACWPWTGATTRGGYGNVGRGGRYYRAHRMAWGLVNGPMPRDLHACHSCDNPPCCNPAHLFPGTNRENAEDAGRKGRLARGERQPTAKLTDAAVLTIRARIAAGDSNGAIAGDYGVVRDTIGMIRRGKTWVHI